MHKLCDAMSLLIKGLPVLKEEEEESEMFANSSSQKEAQSMN